MTARRATASARRGVWSAGAASFFSDAGHELTTSVLPVLLAATLNAGRGSLGVVKGVSDALTGLSKLAGGPLANDTRRRARLASDGHLGTAAATSVIGLVTAVWQVAVLRAAAWVSPGTALTGPRHAAHDPGRERGARSGAQGVSCEATGWASSGSPRRWAIWARPSSRVCCGR